MQSREKLYVEAQRYQLALEATVEELSTSLERFMPECPYRDFYQWAISTQNPHRETWLQVIGARQIVQLTLQLTSDFLNDEQWEWFARHCARINAYLIFEVVSDNLALGLARQRKGDLLYSLRLELVSQFNDITCATLEGRAQNPLRELDALASMAARMSSFQQSLSPAKHRAVAEAYLQQHPHITMDDLEFSIAPLLVTNWAACIDLIDYTCEFVTGDILRQGLYERYASVNRLLHDTSLDLDDLTLQSTYAILLIPTLAYYVEGFAYVTGVRDALAELAQDGALAEVFYLTSLLVRLLNDLGTEFILETSDQRRVFIQSLEAFAAVNQSRSLTLAHVLDAAITEYPDSLTRIEKDLRHGECNVLVYNLLLGEPAAEAIRVFGERLEYFCDLYATSYQALMDTLDNVSGRLGNDGLFSLLCLCVQFHELLYDQPYHQPQGEYAV